MNKIITRKQGDVLFDELISNLIKSRSLIPYFFSGDKVLMI